MPSDHTSLDIVIWSLLLSLVLVAILMMYRIPSYEAGVIAVVQALTNVFSAACGAKWGLTQPKNEQKQRDKAGDVSQAVEFPDTPA